MRQAERDPRAAVGGCGALVRALQKRPRGAAADRCAPKRRSTARCAGLRTSRGLRRLHPAAEGAQDGGHRRRLRHHGLRGARGARHAALQRGCPGGRGRRGGLTRCGGTQEEAAEALRQASVTVFGVESRFRPAGGGWARSVAPDTKAFLRRPVYFISDSLYKIYRVESE
jgi:hypothetical protein